MRICFIMPHSVSLMTRVSKRHVGEGASAKKIQKDAWKLLPNRDWPEPSIFLTHPKPTVPHAVKLYYFALSEDKVEEKPKPWNLSSTICNQTLKST